MQIEAIYNKGRIELPPHLHLKQDVFKVRIEIPEYAYSEKGADPSSDWQSKMEKIKKSVLNMDEKALPELSPKQKESLDAFQIREDQ
ncbi:hypothetical protein OOT00_14905 [Desulfobotulus sp. H1]|uniref:DUF104 domain-containing protein n=1 Tax=Desulfobotulus pelophilus TaxID=2823377 RepID=A0ABT3NCT4_9BACT|nr:hypothetical protein [Desulfobotulus pelophilus]MCW7755274.1 hypothetical protein [Desulfobotulus pelophilus]